MYLSNFLISSLLLPIYIIIIYLIVHSRKVRKIEDKTENMSAGADMKNVGGSEKIWLKNNNTLRCTSLPFYAAFYCVMAVRGKLRLRPDEMVGSFCRRTLGMRLK